MRTGSNYTWPVAWCETEQAPALQLDASSWYWRLVYVVFSRSRPMPIARQSTAGALDSTRGGFHCHRYAWYSHYRFSASCQLNAAAATIIVGVFLYWPQGRSMNLSSAGSHSKHRGNEIHATASLGSLTSWSGQSDCGRAATRMKFSVLALSIDVPTTCVWWWLTFNVQRQWVYTFGLLDCHMMYQTLQVPDWATTAAQVRHVWKLVSWVVQLESTHSQIFPW